MFDDEVDTYGYSDTFRIAAFAASSVQQLSTGNSAGGDLSPLPANL